MDLNVQAFRIVQAATEEMLVSAPNRRTASQEGWQRWWWSEALAMSSEHSVEIAGTANTVRWVKTWSSLSKH